MRKHELRRVKLEKLRPSGKNPRTISEERFEALRKSIRETPEHLEARPIVSTWDGEIVAGEMRWRAMMAEGIEEGPNFRVQLSEDEARLWLLRDNNEYGQWNEDELAQALYELEQAGADLELTGFEKEERSKLIDLVAGARNPQAPLPDDPAPEPPASPKSKPGQVYKLGPHRLMCGDATNTKHVARLLDGAEPTLMVTDPPYGVNLDLAWRADAATRINRNKGKATSGERTKRAGPAGYSKMVNDDRVDWSEAFELVPSLKVVYVWHADKFAHVVAAGLEGIGLEVVQQIIWDKLQFSLSRTVYHYQHEVALYAARLAEKGKDSEVPWYGTVHGVALFARRPGSGMPWLGSRDQPTIWAAPSPKRRAAEVDASEEPVDHPTQKPTLLFTRPYTNHTLRGDAVYEPFAGSGTAIIAAEITGRTCYAMELDPAFVDVARERYKLFTEGA